MKSISLEITFEYTTIDQIKGYTVYYTRINYTLRLVQLSLNQMPGQAYKEMKATK